jgi:hypothetical protein
MTAAGTKNFIGLSTSNINGGNSICKYVEKSTQKTFEKTYYIVKRGQRGL